MKAQKLVQKSLKAPGPCCLRAVAQALTPVPFSTPSLLCRGKCHPKLATYCIELSKWI